MEKFCSFLWPSDVLLYHLFIHFCIDGHLGRLRILAPFTIQAVMRGLQSDFPPLVATELTGTMVGAELSLKPPVLPPSSLLYNYTFCKHH